MFNKTRQLQHKLEFICPFVHFSGQGHGGCRVHPGNTGCSKKTHPSSLSLTRGWSSCFACKLNATPSWFIHVTPQKYFTYWLLIGVGIWFKTLTLAYEIENKARNPPANPSSILSHTSRHDENKHQNWFLWWHTVGEMNFHFVGQSTKTD